MLDHICVELDLERLDVEAEHRERKYAASSQRRVRTAQEGGPIREQLYGLHRDDAKRDSRLELEVAGVRADHLDRQPAAAAGELGRQLVVTLDCDHRVRTPREVERHASRAGADLEDSAGAL